MKLYPILFQKTTYFRPSCPSVTILRENFTGNFNFQPSITHQKNNFTMKYLLKINIILITGNKSLFLYHQKINVTYILMSVRHEKSQFKIFECNDQAFLILLKIYHPNNGISHSSYYSCHLMVFFIHIMIVYTCLSVTTCP